MPSIINVGIVNINTPQQNSSIFIGETVLTGMDANMKFNAGHSGVYGLLDYEIFPLNTNFDNFEMIDGVMNDQDFKPNVGGNV